MTTKDAIKHLSHKIAFAKQCDEKWAGGIHIDALEIAVRAMAEERKKGEWEFFRQGKWLYARCSECGRTSNTGTPYCAYCGSDMREGRTEDEYDQKNT